MTSFNKSKSMTADIFSFTIVYLVPASIIAGYLLGGIYTFMTPVFVFGIVPVFDLVIRTDRRNPDPESEPVLEKKRVYRILTWICAPIQVAIVFWGAHVVCRGDLSFIETIGFVFSVGVSSGILGINVAHELAHRVNGKLEPLLSKIMLATVFYVHWGQEHVVGHHRYVATPEDPATARLGESFYAFWPRTVFGGFNSSWEFAAERMKKQGLPTWSLANPMAVALVVEALLLLFFAIYFGIAGVAYLLGQSFIAFSLLEIVNYIEHYGLLRTRTEEGKYESVKPWHSWNSSNWLTNRFLFNLQRHSDHHYKPGRRYQLLRHYDESPQLPTGYAGMILVALIPPLWRHVMDHRISSLGQTPAEKV